MDDMRYQRLLNMSAGSEKDMELLPIFSPLYNMREICKQIVLLEDHLNHPRKRCPDCIRKHFLTLEALFEEAISLDEKQEYTSLLEGKAEYIRMLSEFWIDKEDIRRIAQGLRKLRKEFMEISFETRLAISVSKVATLHLNKNKHVCAKRFE